MNIWRQFAAWVLALSLLLSVACKKKKPQLPPQAQAPIVSVPLPDEISETAPPPPPPKQEVPAPEPQKPKPPPRHRRKPVQPPATSPENTPVTSTGNATVAAAHPAPSPAEGAPDTAIAADASSQQVSQQKQTTADLLAAAEKNLKSVNRALNHDEQAMVAQIKTYIDQSRKATSENDFERAYNLATKARLLSDALVKK
jgi:type IV secretory pathway VirB10-like protein